MHNYRVCKLKKLCNVTCQCAYRIEKEKLEVDRVHHLTEEERRAEFQHNPKQRTNKAPKGKYKFLQKYYHRGAFYMVCAIIY